MFIKFNDKENTTTISGNIFHDIDGNIILKINAGRLPGGDGSNENGSNENGSNENSSKESNYYFLDINKNDNLEWVELNFENMIKLKKNVKLQYRTIKLTQDKFSLKGKVLDEIEEEDAELELDDEYDENDSAYKAHFKYFPEERDYHLIDDTVEQLSDDEVTDEPTYTFSKYGDDELIKLADRTMDTVSIFDTFVVDKTCKTVLFTLESDQKSAYRVTFDITGRVELNIIGVVVKIYDFYFTRNTDGTVQIVTTIFSQNKIII